MQSALAGLPILSRASSTSSHAPDPDLYTWTLSHQDPTAFRALIRSFLEDGADSYCIWDGHDPYSHGLYGDIGFRDWQGPAPVTAAASGKQHALHVLNAFRVDEYGGGEVV